MNKTASHRVPKGTDTRSARYSIEMMQGPDRVDKQKEFLSLQEALTAVNTKSSWKSHQTGLGKRIVSQKDTVENSGCGT